MKIDSLAGVRSKAFIGAILPIFLASGPVLSATIDIDATVSASGWASGPQFIAEISSEPPYYSGYTINTGDTVNLNFRFSDNEALKLTATEGISGIGFLVERDVGFVYTLENVSVSLDSFVTDSAWNGIYSEATKDQSGYALGAYFDQRDVPVLDGEFIQFSGFQASFTIAAGDAGNGEVIFAKSAVNNWAVETVSPVPLPAAAWLFGSAILCLGVSKRRNST